MLKLPKEFKAAWLAKLRDPNTKQAAGQLSSYRGMCCLGVACVVHDPSCFAGDIHQTPNGSVRVPTNGDVPPEVLEVFQQSASPATNGGYGGSVQNLLALKNDSYDPFSEIADWIEKYL